MPYATVDGIRISYDDVGTGEPALVFTTGWCSSRDRWSRVVALCAANHRVLNTEWRGHGDSDPSPTDFGLEEMVSDVLGVVEEAGVERFVICAASHSGFVAIEVARRFPERVAGLVHVDWYVIPPPPRYQAVLEQLTSEEDWPGARDTLMEIWRAGIDMPEIDGALEVMRKHGADMWMRSGREIMAGYERVGSPTSAWEDLSPPVPVLHLYGQPQDPDFLSAQERFAAGHDWFSVRKLGAQTHFAMIEAAQDVADAIEEFVAATEGARR